MAGREVSAHVEEIRAAILDFVKAYFQKHGYAPSFREIGEGVGLRSAATVHWYVNHMLAEGILETDAPEGTPRAIRVPGCRIMFSGQETDSAARGL